MSGPFKRFPAPVNMPNVPIIGQRKTPRVAVGYSFGPINGQFMLSLRMLERYDRARPVPLMHHDIPQSGLYIEDNRQRVVQKFMATGADWLLQIDSDIQFPPNIIETLLAVAGDEKKVLAASVPLGPEEVRAGRPYTPLPSCGLFLTDEPGQFAYLNPEEITAEGVPCDAVASAVLLVHRDVFQSIARREGQVWFRRNALPDLRNEKSRDLWTRVWRGEAPDDLSDMETVNLGEDLAFCLRAKDAGFQTYVCKITGLRHFKALPLSHDYEAPELVAMEGA